VVYRSNNHDFLYIASSSWLICHSPASADDITTSEALIRDHTCLHVKVSGSCLLFDQMRGYFENIRQFYSGSFVYFF